jgi:hypothetical protein
MAHFHRISITQKRKAAAAPKINENKKLFPTSEDSDAPPDVPPPRPNFPFDGIEVLQDGNKPQLLKFSYCLFL